MCRFQNTGYKDGQWTLWELQQHKKDQSEIKDTLTEVKNNLQGINSRVDEAKNEISNLEYKEVKNTPSEQHKKKKESKKSG